MTGNQRTMRAKLRVTKVEQIAEQENLSFRAVTKSEGYPDDGSDENNSFAKWTPNAELEMTVTNPELHGQFAEGDEFYADFTKVETS